MASTRTLIVEAVLTLGLVTTPWALSAANIMWEEDMRMVCSESGVQSLPKKIKIRQVIDDPFFANASETNVVLFASYILRFEINQGKVVVTGVLVKSDGQEILLPRLSGKMKAGDAEKNKPAGTVFEPGDIIEWTVKLKGLPPLEGFDCWMLELGIVATDMQFAQSGLW